MPPPLVISVTGPEADVMESENRRLVWKGFEHLSPEIRMAVILRDIQGKSYDEIAEVLHLPLGTVKARIHRARNMIQQMLAARKYDI